MIAHARVSTVTAMPHFRETLSWKRRWHWAYNSTSYFIKCPQIIHIIIKSIKKKADPSPGVIPAAERVSQKLVD
jgi:hypothetical protein